MARTPKIRPKTKARPKMRPKSRNASPAKRAARPRRKAAARGTGARWSARVTARSDALDLEPGVFKLAKARSIATSLKRSAERSTRRKADPYRSALSMLVFYMNRAGKNLPAARRKTLEEAKTELRKLFKRDGSRSASR